LIIHGDGILISIAKIASSKNWKQKILFVICFANDEPPHFRKIPLLDLET